MDKFIIMHGTRIEVDVGIFELPVTDDELVMMCRQNTEALAEALGFTGIDADEGCIYIFKDTSTTRIDDLKEKFATISTRMRLTDE